MMAKCSRIILFINFHMNQYFIRDEYTPGMISKLCTKQFSSLLNKPESLRFINTPLSSYQVIVL